MNSKLKNISGSLTNNLQRLINPSFLATQNHSVSLDIGSSYIKAISLERDIQTISITGFSCEKIEADAKTTIKKVLSRIPMKKKELAMSVSGQSVVLRYVNMPLMSDEELGKAMAFELEKHIPFDKNDVNADFTVLKKNKNTGKMLVLIAAAKKDLTNNRLNTIKELGYSPVFVDVCPLAMANYFEYARDSKEGVCAVINLGATLSSVDIIEDGLLVLSRDIFIGGNDFTKKIAEVLNKNIKESESIKLRSLDDNIIQSLEPTFTNLAKELKVSFDFYETQENRSIDKIYITGGSAQLKGLADFFKSFLGQDIELIKFNHDKFKLKPSLGLEEFENSFNFFTIALGMALRRFCK